MIKDLFTKKALAVVCAATLSVGSVAVAFAGSGEYELATSAASASASASAGPEVETTTKQEETTTKSTPSEKPSQEETTTKSTPSEKPSQEETTTATPSAKPSEEPSTDPVAVDTYQILGSFNNWALGSGLFMTQDSSNPNIYTATIKLAAGKYEYQIVKNNSWDYKFSGADGFINSSYPNLTVEVPEEMDVIFTLDLANMTVKTNLDKDIEDQADISAATVTLTSAAVTYNGEVQNPVVASVTLGAATLVEDTDYEVKAIEAKDAGTYTVEVTGKGAYKGTATAEYVINRKTISKATATVGAKTYTGKTLKSSSYSVKLKLNGKSVKLVKGTDYSVTAASGKNAGKYAVTFKGIGNFKGSVKANFVINAKKLAKKNVTVASKAVYTGKAIKAKVTVKDGSKLTTKNYKVTYKNNKKVGKATVTVTGKGNYTGTVKKTFKIVPATVKVKSVKNTAKKTVTVKFNKAKGAASYTVYYKVKGAKKWSKKVTKKTTLKIAKLKKGKTYQVKVVATAKSGKTTFSSADSKVLSVKIKK